jgi:hypothetical protein
MKLEVIKDCYYVVDGRNLDEEYLTKNQLFANITHLLVKGDIWETDNEYPEFLKCVKSKDWLDELNDGWWEYKWVKDFFKVIEE